MWSFAQFQRCKDRKPWNNWGIWKEFRVFIGPKKAVELKDLNLDALMERNPEVVLVDGLAHRNRPDAPVSNTVRGYQVFTFS